MIIIVLVLSAVALIAYCEDAPTAWQREETRKFNQHKHADTILQRQLTLASEHRHYVDTLRRERTCMR